MIEAAMMFTLGFAIAGLCSFMFTPLIWQRAVRLTTRRIKASLPYSITDVEAKHDRLRAEFATTTRDLEKTCERLRQRTAELQMAAGRQMGIIDQLKMEVLEKQAVIAQLEAQSEAKSGAISGLEDRIFNDSQLLQNEKAALTALQNTLAEREGQISGLKGDCDTQRIEIVALKTQNDNLRQQMQEAEEARAAIDRALNIESNAHRGTIAKNEEIGQELSATQKRLEVLETAIEGLRHEKAEKDTTIRQLREAVSQHSAGELRNEKHASALESQLKEAADNQARLESRITELDRKALTQAGNGKTGKTGAAKSDEAMRNLRSELREKEFALKAAESEISSIEATLAGNPNAKNGRSNLRLTENVKMLQELKAERDRAVRENEDLRKALEAARTFQDTSAMPDMKVLRPANDTDSPAVAEKAKTRATTPSELEKLRREVEELTEELKAARAEIASFKENSENDEKGRETYANKIDNVAAKLVTASAETSGQVHQIDKIIEDFVKENGSGDDETGKIGRNEKVSLLSRVKAERGGKRARR